MKVIIIMSICDITSTIIHLGTNPSKGGRPPRDNNIIIISKNLVALSLFSMLVILDIITFTVFIESMMLRLIVE